MRGPITAFSFQKKQVLIANISLIVKPKSPKAVQITKFNNFQSTCDKHDDSFLKSNTQLFFMIVHQNRPLCSIEFKILRKREHSEGEISHSVDFKTLKCPKSYLLNKFCFGRRAGINSLITYDDGHTTQGSF